MLNRTLEINKKVGRTRTLSQILLNKCSSSSSKTAILNNLPCPYQETINEEVINYDNNIDNYNNSVSSFLYKRWSSKNEIAGRMAI